MCIPFLAAPALASSAVTSSIATANALITTSLIGSIGGAAMSFMGQQQQAKAANAAAQQQEMNALASMANEQKQLAYQRDLQRTRNADRGFDERVSAEKARATANVSAAESGVAGLSLETLMGDYYAREARAQRVLQINSEADDYQLNQALVQSGSVAQSRINQAPRLRGPSGISLGLDMLGSTARTLTPYYA